MDREAIIKEIQTKQRIVEIQDEQRRRITYNQLKFYKPYPKQIEFHEADFSERMLGAGNQTGKTFSGSREIAYHATGLYPDDWKGKRFKKPNVGWVGGISGETIRDTTQKLLVGRMQDADSIGSEAIPKDCIIETVKALGVKDLLDHVKVKHITGGTSLIFFKSYEKGRAKFMGETIDWVWLDEEPPADIYSECLTRTNKGQLGQFLFITFTPMLGMTTVAHSFYSGEFPLKHLTIMTIHDVDHYTPEEKVKIIASYPEHEREARSMGVPTVGSGRIFTVPEDNLHYFMQPEKFPEWWVHIAGIDFGWDHPTAMVWMAWDREADVVYIYDIFRQNKVTPVIVAGTIKPKKLEWVPVAWPHDGLQHDKGSGEMLATQYEAQGLNMLEERAHYENERGNHVEPGLTDMLDRMQTGRLKVAAHLSEWFEEYRMYHRKDGKVIKERDDLMSATRYGIMMLRHAEEKPANDDDYEDEFQNDRRDIGAAGY